MFKGRHVVLLINLLVSAAYLVLQLIPLWILVGEVNRGEREANFPKETVPPKPFTVPYTQPQGTFL